MVSWRPGAAPLRSPFVLATLLSAAALSVRGPISAADTIPPTVMSISPRAGQQLVSLSPSITIAFSEPLDPSTVTVSTIRLIDQLGAPVSCSITYAPGTQTVTVVPDAPLRPWTYYQISIGDGPARVADTGGNPMPVVKSDFTTVERDDVHADMQAGAAAGLSGTGPATFTFGVTSDIHLAPGDPVLTRDQWKGIVEAWREAGHLFGVVVGDLGYGDPNGIEAVRSGVTEVDGAPRILYAMGNHEVDEPAGKRAWIDALYPGVVRPGSWTAGAGVAGDSDHVYWSFNLGPASHFVVLDATAYLPADGSIVSGVLGQQQLTWLEADLAANRDRNVFVFLHEPIDQPGYDTAYYTLFDRGPLIDVLMAHPRQKFVFSGHLHSYLGITKWKGITSVHVNGSALPTVTVNVDHDAVSISWPGMTAQDTIDYDLHPMYRVAVEGPRFVLPVGEEDGDYGRVRDMNRPMVTASVDGVNPTNGALMLKTPVIDWSAEFFISEQLMKIVPGMELSYDIRTSGVIGGHDAVAVQPNWTMADQSMPPIVGDQNGIVLSRHTRDGLLYRWAEDLGLLGGRATAGWYHRTIDLTPLAGHYVDGINLVSSAGNARVAATYVDNIKLTWPIAAGCASALGSTTASIGADGGTGSTSVVASDTCAWSATSAASWLTVTSGGHTGGGVLSFSAVPNPTTAARSGLIRVGSLTLTVTQAGCLETVPNRAPVLTNPGDQTNTGVSPTYADAVQSDSPVAYWRLGEVGGSTAADSAGPNSAGISGGVTLGQLGAVADGDGAMLFNGTTGYAQAGNPARALNGDLTLELWVNAALVGRQTLISKGYRNEFELTLESWGQLNFYQGNGSTYEEIPLSFAKITANAWQHVVLTRSVSTRTIRLYVNGTLKGSRSYVNDVAAGPRPVSIGRSDAGTKYVNGRLDEVALYPAALDAARVAAHYAARTAPGTGASVSLQLVANDPDGDHLTYAATGLPPALAVDAATGLITGTLGPASVGVFHVTASASDAGFTSSQTFTWRVTGPNRAPVLNNPGAQTSTLSSAYALSVLADAPIGYWRLDEASGAIAADRAGANPGSIVGGVTLAQAGALTDGNPAMRFDGSTGFVRVLNPAAMLSGDLTIELWANSTLTLRQTLVSKSHLFEFELTLEPSGQLNFYHGTGSTYEEVPLGTTGILANTWHHIVVTRTSSTRTVRAFVNGVLKASRTYTASVATGSKPVSIARNDAGTKYVNGRVDDVALYAAALSASQVSAHYAKRDTPLLGSAIALQLTATDADGDAVSYSASGLPPGLTVSATGLISGSIASAADGLYPVTVTVSDGHVSRTQGFTWTVRR